jgi:hypothetical protein
MEEEFNLKKILVVLLLAALLLAMFAGCTQGDQDIWREIPPSEYGEVVRCGELDRFEVDGEGREWAVIVFDEEPYSASCLATEEINSETTLPGAEITLSFDGDFPFNMRLTVYA